MSPLHVVLGAGQIGQPLAERLAARGHRVRQVRRVLRGGVTGAEILAGDVADPAFAERACRGAEVVYHCMNVPYAAWERALEPLARGALHGAAHAGARLVVLDNLYVYAPSPDRPITEATPVAPPSRKGAIRARLRDRYLGAHARGDARVTIARASDFYGPGAGDAWFGDRFWKRVLAGRAAQCPGDPDLPHAYALTDDVVDALITLGERPEALGAEWIVPHAPAPTTRDLVGLLGRAVGVEAKVARVPRWALRALGVVSSNVRELAELTYQWEAPWLVDDARWRRAFGGAATPLEDGARRTAAWVRRAYAALLAARPAPQPG